MPRNVQTAIVMPLVLVLALAGLGAATHGCNGQITTIPAGTETLYIDDRSDEAGHVDHWVYIESNQLEGLQSGGQVHPFLDCDGWTCLPDNCEHANPDTLIL